MRAKVSKTDMVTGLRIFYIYIIQEHNITSGVVKDVNVLDVIVCEH